MATVCGVCNLQPSKYRCPSCELRYCSIACFKEHKTTHTEELKQEVAPTQEVVNAPASAGRPGAERRTDFSGLENDTELLALMEKHAGLRIQLQSAYGFTLEPPPEQRRFNRQPRGRGRGGRGQFRHDQQQSHGSWTQAKGDKEAAEQIKRKRSADDGADMAEFVRLINVKYGTEQVVAEQ